MAFLIPENLASRGDVPAGLQDVARALRDWCDDDVTVWLEQPPEEPPHLLVLDPASVVVLIDVPPGGAQGLRGLNRGLLRRRTPPSLAALFERLGQHEAVISGRLRTETRVPDGLRAAATVALPFFGRAQVESLLGTRDLDGYLVADDFEPSRLRQALARVAGAGDEAPLTEVEERAVRGLLHPEIVIRRAGEHEGPPREGQLVFRPPEGGEDAIRVLDREQERLARHLGAGYRVIRGVAGAGKTLVLVHRARHLARNFPQWRILLACYNVPLSKALEAQLADCPNVEVRTVDALAWHICRLAHVPFGDDFDERRRTVVQLLAQRPHLREYDVVLVDEAQDLDADGLDVAYSALKPGKEEFVLALDAAQNIYRKRARWTPPGATARGRTTILRVNYRNTQEILEFAWQFLTRGGALPADDLLDDAAAIVPPEATSRRGSPPVVLACANWRAEVDEVVRLIEQRHHDGVPWSSMAVLVGGPPGLQKSLYFACRERGIPYFFVSQNRKSKHQVIECGDKVRVFKVQGVKGLEFSRVFMCGVNDFYVPDDGTPDAQGLRQLVYVAMTRAMDELIITVSGDGVVGRDLLAARA